MGLPTKNSSEHKGLDQFPDLNKSLSSGAQPFGDDTDRLANQRGQYIDIYHIPSGQSVRFKAYITNYNDDYRSDWSDEKVYGRMDPIVQFQGTSRIISLDWDVVAGSQEEAVLNHKKCSLLFSMLYPTYENQPVSSATLINTSPLFKIKFGNLIQSGDSKHGESVGESAKETGLVGTVTGFSYSPDLEAGMVDPIGGSINIPYQNGNFKATPGTMLPKVHKLALEYTVLHTRDLGWDGSKRRDPSFPHGGSIGSNNNQNTSPPQSQQQSNQNVVLGGGNP